MNLPDSFLPFYGNDFFQSVEGRSADLVAGYMRLLWYYWNHEHCEGLDDDDDFLRGVARVDEAKWDKVRAVLFDNVKFFTLEACEDGVPRWQQRRAKEEWANAREQYAAKVARTAAATKARWRK